MIDGKAMQPVEAYKQAFAKHGTRIVGVKLDMHRNQLHVTLLKEDGEHHQIHSLTTREIGNAGAQLEELRRWQKRLDRRFVAGLKRFRRKFK